MPLKPEFPLITSLDFVISVSKVSVRVPAKIPGRVYIISGKHTPLLGEMTFFGTVCLSTSTGLFHS